MAHGFGFYSDAKFNHIGYFVEKALKREGGLHKKQPRDWGRGWKEGYGTPMERGLWYPDVTRSPAIDRMLEISLEVRRKIVFII